MSGGPKVVPLSREADPTVVECLERLLECARNGEITAMNAACLWIGGNWSTHKHGSGDIPALLGAVVYLQQEMLEDMRAIVESEK